MGVSWGETALVLIAATLALLTVLVGGAVLLDATLRRRKRGSRLGANSAIYSGRVWHTRFLPTRHAFTYPIFFFYLDLDELDSALPWYAWPIMSHKLPWSLARFSDSDHLKDHPPAATATGDGSEGVDPPKSLGERVRMLVEAKTGTRPTGPIRLLTHLRYFGYCFNPVSFYYVFDASGERLETIVGEVSNTPWGEMHCYVLNASSRGVAVVENGNATNGRLRYRFPKAFHVSPFMGMDYTYDWHFIPPGASVTVRNAMLCKSIRESSYTTEATAATTNAASEGEGEVQGGGEGEREGGHGGTAAKATAVVGDTEALAFDAKLVMQRVPFSAGAVLKQLVCMPFLCALVQLWIHVEAFQLWRKKVQFFPHPEGAETVASKLVAAVMGPLFKLQAWQQQRRSRRAKEE